MPEVRPEHEEWLRKRSKTRYRPLPGTVEQIRNALPVEFLSNGSATLIDQRFPKDDRLVETIRYS